MIWTLAVLPVSLLVLGFPVFLVLLAGATATLLFVTDLPLITLHQVIFGGIDKYSLLAVPFFVFAGELMTRGGISARLNGWVVAGIGRVRGSLGLTTVGTSTLLGAVSGSSPATVAAVGQALYPALRENGYGERFSLGLITASGSIAIVVPPSIAMILYGAAAEQSVPRLFLAGILPGLLIAGVMALYILIYARWQGIREARRFDARRFLDASLRGLGALLMPVIILGGIYGGFFSPTEAAGVACLYAILLARLGYREASWAEVLKAAGDAAFLTAQVMILVACASLFSWLLTVSGLPQAMVAALAAIELSSWAFLLIVNGLLLLLGCVIDPLSAILVLTPMLLPLVLHLGIDPVHFGIVMTVNLSIGMFTPPFGLNIFVAESLFGAGLRTLCLGLLPFIVLQIAALLVITYVPGLSLLLAGLI